MTALIAFKRAPACAWRYRLDADHHHSGSAIAAPAPFDDLERTGNKLGLRHELLLFQAGARERLSVTEVQSRFDDLLTCSFDWELSGQNRTFCARPWHEVLAWALVTWALVS
jgi:hypothetical protein